MLWKVMIYFEGGRLSCRYFSASLAFWFGMCIFLEEGFTELRNYGVLLFVCLF